MKKFISLLLAVVMLASLLAACAPTESEQTEPKTPPTETQEKTDPPADTSAPEATEPVSAAIPPKNGDHYVIGISQPFMGHPIRQAGQVLIDAWAAEHPDCEIIVTDGQLDAQKQISDLEDMMVKDVDIILVAAHQSPTLVSVLADAKAAGFPIIAFDRLLTDTSVQIGSILNDEIAGGHVCGELMKEALGEEGGDIVILLGPAGNTGSDMRHQGFLEEIEGTNINVVDTQVADFQRVNAVDIFENMLQANPNLSGVFCANDEMALGVCQVLEAANRTDIKVVGYDGQKDAMEAVIAGKLYGTARKVVEFPYSLDMAYEYLTTGTIAEPNLNLPPIKINADTVTDYYDPDAVF